MPLSGNLVYLLAFTLPGVHSRGVTTQVPSRNITPPMTSLTMLLLILW